jgi:hypothetical protein
LNDARLSSSTTSPIADAIWFRLVRRVVAASSRRIKSDRLVLITGTSFPGEGLSGGDSRLPPTRSTKARPVSPCMANVATVSSLMGVPSAISRVSRTCSRFSGSSPTPFTLPTLTPLYFTAAFSFTPETESRK